MDQTFARAVLLDAATQTFSHYGFHGSTVQEIADLAAQSKPRLYSHFRSKDDLYLAALEQEERHLRERLIGPVAKLGRERPGDIEATCDEMVRLICGYQEERPDGFGFLFGTVNWRIETQRRRRLVLRLVAAVLHCLRPHLPAQPTNGITAPIACSVVATAIATTEAAVSGRIKCEEAAETMAGVIKATVDMTIQGTESASKKNPTASESDK